MNCSICWWTLVAMITFFFRFFPTASAGASADSVLPVPQAPSKRTSFCAVRALYILSIASRWFG